MDFLHIPVASGGGGCPRFNKSAPCVALSGCQWKTGKIRQVHIMKELHIPLPYAIQCITHLHWQPECVNWETESVNWQSPSVNTLRHPVKEVYWEVFGVGCLRTSKAHCKLKG